MLSLSEAVVNRGFFPGACPCPCPCDDDDADAESSNTTKIATVACRFCTRVTLAKTIESTDGNVLYFNSFGFAVDKGILELKFPVVPVVPVVVVVLYVRDTVKIGFSMAFD